MSRYTILHTIETAGPGGAENVLLSLVSNLDATRFHSLVVLPEGRWLPKKLRERGISTVTADSKGWYDLSLLRTLARLVRRERVNLIHSHLPDQNFYSCLVGRLTNCKTIVTYHGSPNIPTNGGTRRAVKAWVVRHSADAVVVVSDYLKGLFAGAGFPADRITRIYNGVNICQFDSSGAGRLRADLGCPPGAKLVGMVANLRRSKGYEYFIRAARKVSETLPQTRFVAVGEIETGMASRMTALKEELGLQDRFLFLGFREDIAAVLSDLDVFVLSSVSEGLSIATLEAMAAGKPVVVTRSGGPQEIVEDGRTGFLVPPADPAALAARICELLDNPNLAATLGRNARQEVENKFSLAGMIGEYERLYERCLNHG
jgi:glycosyltransferase involved in cell wall biosynthesis